MSRPAILGGGVAALAAAAVAAFLLMRGPPASSGEEGTFENDCCGTVTLAQGRLSLNGRQSIRYDIGRDAEGAYLLPRTYVGIVEDQGFDVDGTQPARKLRLDRLPAPQAIQLPIGSRTFVFRRKALRVMTPAASTSADQYPGKKLPISNQRAWVLPSRGSRTVRTS